MYRFIVEPFCFKLKFIWNFSTVEGDSPVDILMKRFMDIFFLSRIRWISGLNVGGINS